MTNSTEFLDFLAEQLEAAGPVSIRRMFGGSGVFWGDVMFGLVSDDTLYFKVSEANLADYQSAGTEPFTYSRQGGRRIAMTYYRVPDDLLEDPDELVSWARKAVDAALASAKNKAGTKTKGVKAKPAR